MERFKHNTTSRLQVQDPLCIAALRKMTHPAIIIFTWAVTPVICIWIKVTWEW